MPLSERAAPRCCGGAAPLGEPPAEVPAPSTRIEVHAPSSNLAYSALSGHSASRSLAHSKDELSRRVHNLSLVVNLLLWSAKTYVYVQSQALVVLASLIDSTIDLLAQGILLFTNRLATQRSTQQPQAARDSTQAPVAYPVGQSRAEPVGVIACALMMAMASALVVRDSAMVLWDWWAKGEVRPVVMDATDEVLLGGTILLKLALYWYCQLQARATSNVTVKALAQDHLNDVLSNGAALFAALMTQLSTALWLADPVGAILISLYIIYSWAATGLEQLDLIVGKTADPAFLDLVREMAETHDPAATLDVVRAYHFGPRFLVEVEIVMAAETPLRESHDVGITLQDKIEKLDEVDRAFVHMDYMTRELDDHDPKTPLAFKTHEAKDLPSFFSLPGVPEGSREASPSAP